MDGYRFDDLVRSLAASTSRRRFIASLFAGALAAVEITGASAASTRRGPGRTCRGDENCVDGAHCLPVARNRRVCVCDDGLRACRDTCIPVGLCCGDADCRSFSSACTKGVCVAGQCQPKPYRNGTKCPTGLCCDGGCVACCNGVGACKQCDTPSECPGEDSECATRTCIDNQCGISFTAAGTAISNQTPGDCKRNVCNGAGTVISVNDDTDLPADDDNECTTESCTGGVPANTPVAAGSPCTQNGGSVCDGDGACVQCVVASDCPGLDLDCQTRTCTSGVCGFSFASAGTPTATQTDGDCKRSVCNGAGGSELIDDDTDLPDDGNPCTLDVCTAGDPSNPPAPQGTLCGDDGVCDGAGSCVGCVTPADCPGDDTECQTRTCIFNTCGISFTDLGTPVSQQTPGDCRVQVCDGAGGVIGYIDDVDLPADDGNECTASTCTDGEPSHEPLPAETLCDQNGGTVCNGSGACVKSTGQPCSSAPECLSTHCVDGVCCDTACDGLCLACTAALKGAGDDGVCGPIPSGSDPHHECPGAATCDGSGSCTAAECTVPTDCPGSDTECQTRTCVAGTCGFAYTAAGTPVSVQTSGDCKRRVCDGSGGETDEDDDTDLPVTGNQCAIDACTNGVPSSTSAALDTPCNQNGGTVCDGNGACVQCTGPTHCPGEDTECQTRTCITNTCGVAFTPANTPLAIQTPGDCQQSVCDGAGGTTTIIDDTDTPLDDGNPCASATCSGGVPSTEFLPVGTECSGFPLIKICNSSGNCVPQADLGTPCTLGVECRSDLCVDGYCCDSICTATCRACDVPGQLGNCVIATGTFCAEFASKICTSDGQCVDV